VQLLLLHPRLHITYLLSPAVESRIKTELASANFGYVHTSPQDADVLARMQLVEVRSEDKQGQGNSDLLTDMEGKAAAYAQSIAAYPSTTSSRISGQAV
jgi:hypothetical protein